MSEDEPIEEEPRRVGRLWPMLLLVTAVVVGIATVPLFVLPEVDGVAGVRAGGPVDAVVVLGGGPGDRFGTAVDLVAQLPEPPPVFVISVPYGEPVIGCGSLPQLPRVELRCFTPEPFTTAGEIAWTVTTAEAEGWDRVVVVTSDFHITRSRGILKRCEEARGEDIDDLWVAAETSLTDPHGLFAVVTEWPSHLGERYDVPEPCADG